jgi:hypothetical protein
LSEAALGLSGFERRTVKQQLVFRDAQQERSLGAFRKAVLQLIPGDDELPFCPFVVQPIEANILYEYVQTVDECARGGDPTTFVCICRDDNVTPGNSRYPPRVMRTMRRCTLRR